MTSGDFATARTFSGGRDGTARDMRGEKVLEWTFNGGKNSDCLSKYPHVGNYNETAVASSFSL